MNAAVVQHLVSQAHQYALTEGGITFAILALVETLQPDEPAPRALSKADAEAQGFTVDTAVYPWFAYKGPRFEPTVMIPVQTPAHDG